MENRFGSSGRGLSNEDLDNMIEAVENPLIQYAVGCLRMNFTDEEIRVGLADYVQRTKLPAPDAETVNLVIKKANAMRWIYEMDRRPPPPDQLQMVSLGQVQPEPVRWLWPRKIPLGKLTVVYGNAATGKTSWALDLAARISAGLSWPELSGTPPPGSAPCGRVLLLNSGDDPAATIQPRLAGSGANLDNIHAVQGIEPSAAKVAAGGPRAVDLERDIPSLRYQIETLGDVKVVIIDPLEAYCRAAPRSPRMRALLAALEKLAAECDVAVVLISACKRCELPVKNVWRVDSDVRYPDLRWWVPVRCNYGRLPEQMAFRINEKQIEWDLRAYSVKPAQLEGGSAKEVRNSRQRDLNMFLLTALALGPRPGKEVIREGASAGWSAWQIKRAKEPLHVNTYKDSGQKGQWMWELTEQSVIGISLPTDSPPELPPRPSEKPAEVRREEVFLPPQPKSFNIPSVAVAARSESSRPRAPGNHEPLEDWLLKREAEVRARQARETPAKENLHPEHRSVVSETKGAKGATESS